MDSRIELFPAELWTDVQTVESTNGEWLSALNRHRVDVIVVPSEQAELRDTLDGGLDWMQCASIDGEGSIHIRARNDLSGIAGCS